MRNGLNPGKLQSQLTAFGRHRVIVPVYIPTFAGYFANSLQILCLTLESLRLSAGDRACVTVVANGCAPEVLAELRRRVDEGSLDQLIINKQNRGKVDAVTSAARASFEKLITIADADVMFLSGWMDAVERIFVAFPECGFVSPVPNPAVAWSLTSATVLGGALRGELRYEKIVSDEDLDRFAHSVGSVDWFKDEDRRAQLIVRRKDVAACVGGGHFVFTLRRELVDGIPKAPSLHALKVGAEGMWLDEPPDRLGYWKLAPTRAYAYHLGNVLEPWMHDALERCRSENGTDETVQLPPLRRGVASRFPWAVRPRLSSALRMLYRRTSNRGRKGAAEFLATTPEAGEAPSRESSR
jgi:hypothetical protein